MEGTENELESAACGMGKSDCYVVLEENCKEFWGGD